MISRLTRRNRNKVFQTLHKSMNIFKTSDNKVPDLVQINTLADVIWSSHTTKKLYFVTDRIEEKVSNVGVGAKSLCIKITKKIFTGSQFNSLSVSTIYRTSPSDTLSLLDNPTEINAEILTKAKGDSEVCLSQKMKKKHITYAYNRISL